MPVFMRAKITTG